jgi:hypothetical protein
MVGKSLKISIVAAAIALATGSASAQKAGTMEVVGSSGVSGQMMFLQSNGQVAILDKVENNPIQRPTKKGPAAAVFYNYQSNGVKADDLMTNPFCAGGMTLGDGRWLVVGGNKAVGPGGVTAKQNKSPYYDRNGGKSIRFLSPCSGDSCQWTDQDRNGLLKERWYATLEPMRDGHVMILGGMRDGGFVPSQASNEPSYEFYPNVGGVYQLDILRRTVPLSLYPISFLMSNNQVFIQANKQAILWNTDTLKETRLPNINGPPRVYPASGGSAMLPLTPANNYKETILFCGGQSLGTGKAWGNEGGPAVMVTQKPASTSCTQISPLVDPVWRDQDPLPEGRSMGQFINLPDGTLWFGNGVKTGVAGYTTDPKSPGKPVGTSFGDNPSFKPLVYNPNAASGNKWSQVGSTNIGRLYHSSATLLPDSSIMISGSNPSPDVNLKQKWKTTYQVERWYPTWYDQPRPSNDGLPNSIGYGGQGFTLNMDSSSDASNAKVVVIRTGFSTHGFNMGQRMLELRSVASGNQLNVAAMPANPALFAPGPALMFVVVNGIASQGKFITVGNGQIGQQPVGAETSLNKRDVAGRAVSRRASADHKMNHLHMRAANVTAQVPSLDRVAKARADRLAEALQGAPVKGVKLATTFEGILDSFKDNVQSAVESVANQFQEGEITDHLSG